jgi:hypothetical protein
MPTDDYEYCKIYTNLADSELVKALLARALGGQFDRNDMDLDAVSLSVLRNKDFDHPMATGSFVWWPTMIEIERQSGAEDEQMRESVTLILTTLWNAAAPAVAACDFEHALPHNGGINHPLTVRAESDDAGTNP